MNHVHYKGYQAYPTNPQMLLSFYSNWSQEQFGDISLGATHIIGNTQSD
ncbi:hypothetical protein N008_18050 [Hymenobacter sp. APR13]|nr:hypothetical protein N008_18050 [Hymenobacter sp. APR13]